MYLKWKGKETDKEEKKRRINFRGDRIIVIKERNQDEKNSNFSRYELTLSYI